MLVAQTGQLTPGIYENAVGQPFVTPGHPGMSVDGNSTGCNTLTGRFIVDDAQYDAQGSPVTFSARFEQHCESFDAALFGALSYNSTAAYRTRTLSPASLSFASLNGSATATSVTVTNSGPSTLSPSVININGPNASDFAITANTCANQVPAGGSCAITIRYARWCADRSFDGGPP
jgi:hypothetical protein